MTVSWCSSGCWFMLVEEIPWLRVVGGRSDKGNDFQKFRPGRGSGGVEALNGGRWLGQFWRVVGRYRWRRMRTMEAGGYGLDVSYGFGRE